MSATAISYTGVAKIEPAYGPYRVTGLHGLDAERPGLGIGDRFYNDVFGCP